MVKKIQASPFFLVYDDIGEMEGEDQELIQQAMKACGLAYAPYSNFFVGAAVLLENGEVVLGANQENAAYPSGLCAERVTLFATSSCHPGKAVKKIAVAARWEGKDTVVPAPPCGSCRQVMLEYENKQENPIEILMLAGNGQWVKAPLGKGFVALLL